MRIIVILNDGNVLWVNGLGLVEIRRTNVLVLWQGIKVVNLTVYIDEIRKVNLHYYLDFQEVFGHWIED